MQRMVTKTKLPVGNGDQA